MRDGGSSLSSSDTSSIKCTKGYVYFLGKVGSTINNYCSVCPTLRPLFSTPVVDKVVDQPRPQTFERETTYSFLMMGSSCLGGPVPDQRGVRLPAANLAFSA